MALFECRKKSGGGYPNLIYGGTIGATTFTDNCYVGDIYIFEISTSTSVPSGIQGLTLLDSWKAGSQGTYIAQVYRATSNSISITLHGSSNSYARFSRIEKPLEYSVHDLVANTNIDISTNENDLIIYPFNASSLTYTLVSNLRQIAAYEAGNYKVGCMRALNGSTSTFKDTHSYKVVRLY